MNVFMLAVLLGGFMLFDILHLKNTCVVIDDNMGCWGFDER